VYWWFSDGLTNREQFWLVGLFLTGLTLIFIGAFLGSIGRAARKVEMPPVSATNKEAMIQQTAAANPPVVMAPASGSPAVNAMPAQAMAPAGTATKAGYPSRQ
jgi:hypothetical protein